MSKEETKSKKSKTAARKKERKSAKNEPEIVTAAEPKKKRGRDEEGKSWIMWSGVVFFMVLVFAGWLFNIRQISRKSRLESQKTESQKEVSGFLDDLNQSFAEVQKGMEELKIKGEEQALESEAETKIEELKNKLEAQGD